MSQLQHEHANMQAYVTGFILSLIFTFIPYYLVVNHTLSGTALLLVILGFGVLQMLVQVIFFLHIGRSPQQKWQLIFLIMTVTTILVVVGGSIVITRNLHYAMKPSDTVMKIANDEAIYQVGGQKTGACEKQGTNHQIMIMNDVVSPGSTTAKLCDTLTFINHDNESKELTFGQYPDQMLYAGEDGYQIRANQNKTITLSEIGSYSFYDKTNNQTKGSFSVSE